MEKSFFDLCDYKTGVSKFILLLILLIDIGDIYLGDPSTPLCSAQGDIR